MKKIILIEAPYKSISGYGSRARDLIKAIIDLYGESHEIQLRDYAWATSQTLQSNELDIFTPFELFNGISIPDVYMFFGVPTQSQQKGLFNVLVTAGIESDLIHQSWVDSANKMNLVLVPSNHAKNGFTNNPLFNTKIEVLFEGIDTNVYKVMNDTSLLSDLHFDTSFNFLFIGQWLNGDIGHDRKDVGMLIKTFYDTFASNEEVGLILKTNLHNFSRIDLNAIKQRINSLKPKDSKCKVYLIHGDLNENETNKLYNISDCFVSFSKGECWGRDTAQYLTQGKPIIATNWSSHLDYLNENNAILLKGELKNVHPTVANNMLIPESKWYYTDYTDAIDKMLDVYNNYNSYKDKIVNISDRFSIEQMKNKFKNLMSCYF